MSRPAEITRWQSAFISVSPAMKALFAKMDKKYHETAQRLGFRCDGCADSCCRSLFYHHTFLEYFLIQEGFHTLGSTRQTEVKKRAEAVCNHLPADHGRDQAGRAMCPLNFNGRCSLYAYRPMICRLHGIPHEFQRPDRKVITGPGCKVFGERLPPGDRERLDRTPFYLELAALENDFKLTAGIEKRMKMTIAEIICAFGNNIS